MKLDKKTMRNIQWLIVFTVMVIVICFKIDSVMAGVQYVIALLSPFLLGAAMAFVINVLMRFLEEKVFGSRYLRDKRMIMKIRRPSSLILAILCILGLMCIICFVVIPQLGVAVHHEFSEKRRKQLSWKYGICGYTGGRYDCQLCIIFCDFIYFCLLHFDSERNVRQAV